MTREVPTKAILRRTRARASSRKPRDGLNRPARRDPDARRSRCWRPRADRSRAGPSAAGSARRDRLARRAREDHAAPVDREVQVPGTAGARSAPPRPRRTSARVSTRRRSSSAAGSCAEKSGPPTPSIAARPPDPSPYRLPATRHDRVVPDGVAVEPCRRSARGRGGRATPGRNSCDPAAAARRIRRRRSTLRGSAAADRLELDELVGVARARDVRRRRRRRSTASPEGWGSGRKLVRGRPSAAVRAMTRCSYSRVTSSVSCRLGEDLPEPPADAGLERAAGRCCGGLAPLARDLRPGRASSPACVQAARSPASARLTRIARPPRHISTPRGTCAAPRRSSSSSGRRAARSRGSAPRSSGSRCRRQTTLNSQVEQVVVAAAARAGCSNRRGKIFGVPLMSQAERSKSARHSML